MRKHLVGRGRAGKDGYSTAHTEQVSGDVPFHTVVERDDVWSVGRRRGKFGFWELCPVAQRFGPLNGSAGHHFARQIAANQPRAGLGAGHEPGVIEIDRGKDAFHGALAPQPTDEHAGVDTLEADDAPVFQIGVQIAARAEVAHPAALFAHDESGQMRLTAFMILVVDAVVADFGVGHRDDLAAIARIGQDFLIAGHRRVEADLAFGFAFGAKGRSGQHGSVFEGKFSDGRHGVLR